MAYFSVAQDAVLSTTRPRRARRLHHPSERLRRLAVDRFFWIRNEWTQLIVGHAAIFPGYAIPPAGRMLPWSGRSAEAKPRIKSKMRPRLRIAFGSTPAFSLQPSHRVAAPCRETRPHPRRLRGTSVRRPTPKTDANRVATDGENKVVASRNSFSEKTLAISTSNVGLWCARRAVAFAAISRG